MNIAQLVFLDAFLVHSSFTLYHLLNSTGKPIGHVHYIDKRSKTIQGLELIGPAVKVADLSSFPCEILTTVPIWDRKLMIIGKQCGTSGIIQLPHFKLTLLNTRLSHHHRQVSGVATPKTLYVCGWNEIGVVEDVSCNYMNKDSMKFVSIKATFTKRRTSFSMYIILSNLCVFGGFKNKFDRTQDTECASINEQHLELQFVEDKSPNLKNFRGEASSQQLGSQVMFCGGMSTRTQSCEVGSWRLSELPSLSNGQIKGLKEITNFVNKHHSCLLDKEVKIVPVSDNTYVAIMYSISDTERVGVLAVGVVGSAIQVAYRIIDIPLDKIVPLSVPSQVLKAMITATTSTPLTSIPITSTLVKSVKPSPELVCSSTEVDPLSVGLIITLTVAIVIIMLLIGYICKNRRTTSRNPNNNQDQHDESKSITLSLEPQLSNGRCEQLLLDKSLSYSKSKTPNTCGGPSLSSHTIESTIDAGADSSTIKTISVLFDKAADFGSKPTKQRPHKETSKVETVTTSIPSDTFAMMNPRAEDTYDSPPVPFTDMPIQFLKRILRIKRRNQCEKNRGKVL